MTREDLFAAIGAAEEELLEQSEETSRKNSRPWAKWAAMAACFAVIVMAGLPFLSLGGSDTAANDSADTSSMVTMDDAMAESTGVEENATATKTDEGLEYDWGIELTAEDVTPTGLTLVWTQSGGEVTGELQTGTYYVLEVMEDDLWVSVETVLPESEIGWDALAYILPSDGRIQWEINWQWLYGELPAGEYRIGKEVMDFRGTGDYDTQMQYAEFTVE